RRGRSVRALGDGRPARARRLARPRAVVERAAPGRSAGRARDHASGDRGGSTGAGRTHVLREPGRVGADAQRLHHRNLGRARSGPALLQRRDQRPRAADLSGLRLRRLSPYRFRRRQLRRARELLGRGCRTTGTARRGGQRADDGIRGKTHLEWLMKHALGCALLLLIASAGGADAAGRCGDHPWCDTSLPADTRAGLLLEQLTPDERISLLGGDDLFGVGGQAGSHTGTSNGVPRVDLPTIYYTDGPQGVPLGVGVLGDRYTVNVVVDERTLREIYLPAFEAAVNEANVGSVMCSYNRLNGEYACENEHLLETILRYDWGFAGYVLSDY